MWNMFKFFKNNIIIRKKKENNIKDLTLQYSNPYKTKYLIVLHNYWMGHVKWEHFVIEVDTLLEAEKEASLMTCKRIKTFNHCNYFVIKV